MPAQFCATCIWITGLPAAGKSSLAVALADELNQRDVACYVLDGDELRKGLCSDLGYGEADRRENVRRVGEVARLIAKTGAIVIVSLISPFRKDRDAVRSLFGGGAFVEVFIDTPLEVCEWRDPKGHYRRARAGDLNDFTGVTSAYEPPENPEVRVMHDGASAREQAQRLVARLDERGLLADPRGNRS